jgi:hypothetical protein
MRRFLLLLTLALTLVSIAVPAVEASHCNPRRDICGLGN